MCFSASASFGASAVLTGIGLYTLSCIKDERYRAFASIPLLFGIQQGLEGIVWITLNRPDLVLLSQCATYGYLSIAFVLWPLWIPLSLYPLEESLAKKQLLFGSVFAGLVVALGFLFCVLSFGALASIYNHHIYYSVTVPPSLQIPGMLLYTCATIVPFFISTASPLMKPLGVLLALSYVVSWYSYYETFTSVWCFFAALLSILIFLIIR